MRQAAGRPCRERKPYPDGECYREYWCSPSGRGGCGKIFIDQRALDAAAAALAIEILSDPRHAGQVEAAAAAHREEAARLDAEIAAAEETARALADRLGRGELSLDRFDAATGPLDARLAELRARRAGLDGPDRPLPAGPGDWAARWQAATREERRGLLRQALRGRPLLIGLPDPEARADVTKRISIGEIR